MSAKKSIFKPKPSLLTVETPSRKRRGQLQAQASDISIALSDILSQKREVENTRDRQLLLSFRGNNAAAIQQSVIQYLKDESQCTDAAILGMYKGDECRLFPTMAPLSKKSLSGVSQVIAKMAPLLLDENCVPWRQLFAFLPKVIVLIPIIFNRLVKGKRLSNVEAIAVLGFQAELPTLLAEESRWSTLLGFCQLTAPLLVNLQYYEEAYGKARRTTEALQAFKETEKLVHDISACINSIGLELQSLFGVSHSIVFIIQDPFFDASMVKYCSFGGGKIDIHCLNRELHGLEKISQTPNVPIGWTATYKKIFVANVPSDLEKFNLANGPIHSVGGCIVKNIMCIPITDIVGETPLVVEMSDKPGGFSKYNESDAIFLGKRLSFVLSSAVLLDYRKKAGIRNDINNEVLNNIKTIQFTKVKQLLDMKFRYSHAFQKKFFNFNFTLRQLLPGQLPGVILYMFMELGFIARWKIRKATLIRFILSIKQGYKDNPYHNWKHACTVTHFAYLILRKLELQKHGVLTDMEALAFIVACLCHDVDHRGVNNHFSTDAENYHLYRQEESVMERHHVAVTLQVLSSDDCNILGSLTDAEYKEFVDLVQWNILATDLGKYLQNRNVQFATLKTFDNKNAQSRKSLLSVLMTMCDLCETVKPWNDYMHTVKSIFSEFFAQGDDEIKLGFNPTPIMDRKIAYIPYIEMKFINDIVRPAYQVIAELLPKTAECLQTIDHFKDLWLIATKVFTDNTHVEDPLDIIDSKDMREENLKSMTYPELERAVLKIRQSTVQIQFPGLHPLVPLQDSSTMNMNMNIEDLLGPEEDFQKRSCSNWFKKFFCCLKCRKKKALCDAAFITRFHQEIDFMERRSDHYESKRSILELGPDVVKIRTRVRINSLINPDEVIDLGGKP